MTTIEDIARAVGVSKSTVSRVLNGRDTPIQVSPKTRQRVVEVARELNYHPNPFARGLKTKTSHIVGIVIRDLTNPFWSGLIKGIADGCRARNYHVVLGSAASGRDEEETAGIFIGQVGADGILVVGDFPGDADIVRRALSCCRNAVAVCRGLDPSIAPVIRVDDRGGFRLLMEHVYGLGHRKVGFIGLANPEGYSDRYVEYRAFVAERGLDISERLVVVGDPPGFPSENELIEIGMEAARSIIESGEVLDAIVCMSDPTALGALRAARDAGLEVPRDLSIAGFDDNILARYCTPSLTTIRQPVEEMGQAAARLLIDLIEGSTSRPTAPILFTPELIVRESTASRGWRTVNLVGSNS